MGESRASKNVIYDKMGKTKYSSTPSKGLSKKTKKTKTSKSGMHKMSGGMMMSEKEMEGIKGMQKMMGSGSKHG